MRPGALLELVLADLRRSVRTFALASLGISAGVASLAFFLALSAGMKAVVLGKIFPIDRVEVIPPESSVGAVLSVLGTRPPGIDSSQVSALRHIPGVRSVLPRMRLAFPSSGRGGRAIFGRDVGAGEIPADGVEPAMVRPDLRTDVDFSDPDPRSSHRVCARTEECPSGEFCQFQEMPRPGLVGGCYLPLPVVVSPYLVEVFNGAIAPAHRLPRLGAFMLQRASGLMMEWDLGRAGLGGARQGTPRRVYARLVGVSPAAMDLGLTIPMDTARRLNREFSGDDSADRYSSAAVYLTDASRLTEVAGAVRALGLEIQTHGAEQIGLMVTVITLVLSLTSLITVLIASLNITHVFLTLLAERKGELGLMRALGARARDIRRIILLESGLMGLGSSLLGMLAARLAAALCDHLASTRLPDFPFKPDGWFVFTPVGTALSLGFGVGACVIAALLPAYRAARVDPASALASGV